MNQAASDAGQLAKRLSHGYYAHMAALSVAADPRAKRLIPQKLKGHTVPIGTVKRKDGTEHAFHFALYLSRAATDEFLITEFEQTWLAGSLLKLGDRLAQHGYFDRAPELELVRHLRNGIAHGNRFRIDKPQNLTTFPAHNRLAWVKSDTKALFEITPAVHGQVVLFDYIGAADVLDVIMSVGSYLIRMGNGDPVRP